MTLGTITFLSFLTPLIFRPYLKKKFVEKTGASNHLRRAFFLDFTICIVAGLLMNTHSYLRYSISPVFLIAPMIGSIIAGLFIGIDAALAKERQIILQAMQEQTFATVPQKFFSVTQKFTAVAITTAIFVAIVIILVFLRDIAWLADNVQNARAIHDATMSVISEVFFIMLVLTILIVNLIFSYSRNITLLFHNETEVLEKVSRGDLSAKVPIATQDEFGLIAGHTNQMIDGLRHRFKLITSLKLAEEVQQNLLPAASPYLKNFDISGTSIYCDQTGGDYYDYFLLPKQSLGVVVADAVGHGVGAAMLMTSVRAFLTSAIQRYQNPASLITEVNHYISVDCSTSGRFTTMFFVEIDPENKTLHWVRAGHEPPLFYHAAGRKFSQLEGSGLVLGIDGSYGYEEYITDNLLAGDIIFIGTDGISEARNQEGEFFGRERLKKCLQLLAPRPTKEIQVELLKEVDLFCAGHKQEDDITLVLIKVTS